MKYSLVALACLVAACDSPVPRDDVPPGLSIAPERSLLLLPTTETDTTATDTTATDTTSTGGPYCDDPCSTAVACGAYASGCYKAVCSDGCCASQLKAGATVCSGGGCCISKNGTCACDGGGNPTITCSPGYTDCDDDLSNGCEGRNDTTTSCGATCTNCSTTMQHVDAANLTCEGTCKFSACQVGWADCDGNYDNGCETSKLTSVAHCGGCNQPCTAPANATPICSSGTCDFSCMGPYLRCGNECKLCCGDADCTSPPTRCHQGKCTDGACVYTKKSCLVRDCFSTPMCNDATGECDATPLTGGACGNNACSSGSGLCQDGVCDGAVAKDCSAGVPMCKVGRCDVTDGCAYEDQADDSPCTPTDKCYEPGVCIAGACNGAKKSCADPGVCKTSICNPDTGNCDVLSLVQGSPCTLNNACRQNEACDGVGNCAGTELTDGTPCEATCGAGAAGQCTAGSCGCVTLPDLAAPEEEPTGTADLAVTTGGGKDKDKGCAVSGEPPSVHGLIALLLWGALLVGLRRPHARLVKHLRHHRR